jgi:hypothetical protein
MKKRVAVFFVVVLSSAFAQSGDTPFKAPRAWNDRELSDWATPLAALNVRPGHYSERQYYSAPAGDFVSTYPVFQSLPNLFPFPNPSGFAETYNINKTSIDLPGPFFQSLGTNGRSCSSCHRPAEAWSVSAAEVQLRFLLTQGLDPIFRTNDGSTCDHNIDTSTLEGRHSAYSLLLNRGLIRISLAVPPNAQFTVINVSNPYGCSDIATLSMYRRPLPATNLRFLSTVMFDGRESSTQTGTQNITYATNPADLVADLAHQAIDATTGHAQAAAHLLCSRCRIS